jgi:8-oxo-dGTP pyrophosphatase MutT (NUDIX family)
MRPQYDSALPAPWTRLSTHTLGDHRIFKLRQDRLVSPRTGGEHDFVVLETPDWVNVLAVTPADKVVLIKQYRVGTAAVTIEVPGGMVDPGESPADAAVRELLEETGYAGPELVDLGWVEPNPAIQTNRCHTFLVQGAVLTRSPALEEREDIDVEEMPLSEIPRLIQGGAIRHALVCVAFQKLALHRAQES